MKEGKLKHLEFIQNNINRMSTNSFLVKGWTITFLSALFAFAKNDANGNYVFLTYFSIPLFWYLDAYFLLQERKFREIYEVVRNKTDGTIDFSMTLDKYDDPECTFISSFLSKTVWPIYLFMILICILVLFVF
jgi:hypothetical protein